MIKPAIDQDGRLRYVSLVPPLSAEEHAAFIQAVRTWKNQPVIWSHNPPDVQIIQLPERWEPEIEDTP